MRIHYDIEDLRAFCKLAEFGHYTDTASALCISPSALSRRIVKLEQGLGGRLFNRSTRRIELTEAGLRLYERVLPLVQQLDQCYADTYRLAHGYGDKLTVALIATLSHSILPRVMSSFRSRYPRVYLTVRDGHADRVTSLVEEGVAMFGITTPVPLKPTLVAEKIADFGYHLVYSPTDKALTRRRRIGWSQLSELRVVGLAPTSSTRQQIDTLLNANKISLPWCMEADQLSTLVALVQTGEFCSVLPDVLDATRFGLRSLPIVQPSIARDLLLVSRRGATQSAPGRHLASLLQIHLR